MSERRYGGETAEVWEQSFDLLGRIKLGETHAALKESLAHIRELTAALAAERTAREDEPHGTPAADWRVKGEPDPHGSRYDGERVTLTKGELSDDTLANAVYLCDHRTSFDSIIWLTAAKERIRWLSRKLIAAEVQLASARLDARESSFAEGLEAAAERIEGERYPTNLSYLVRAIRALKPASGK